RLRVVNSGGVAVVDQTVTTNTSAVFTYGALVPDNYSVWIKGAQTLAELTIVTMGAGNNALAMGLMRQGDANNDNVVNITDFSILAASFGKVEGVTDYDARADFSGDDNVNINDFSLLAANFGQSGDAQP
ncbi:MAG: hypothetical protein SGJ24_14580, partial [Chloroflexota bacterium]|nr:hypothetical protein [Chloroflexota bacterium]